MMYDIFPLQLGTLERQLHDFVFLTPIIIGTGRIPSFSQYCHGVTTNPQSNHLFDRTNLIPLNLISHSAKY